MADNLHDLALIIKSRFPLVQVETSEEVRMMQLLERVANLEGWPLFVWSIADGIRRVPRTDVITQTYEFQAALRPIDKPPQNGIAATRRSGWCGRRSATTARSRSTTSTACCVASASPSGTAYCSILKSTAAAS